jgi:membrane protein implicated in regulation of membrane protease activity
MYCNWRYQVLIALSIIAFILLVCEADDMGVFFIAKAVAAVLVAVIYLLGKYWYKQGNLGELDMISE